MTVVFEIPPEIEQHLSTEAGGTNRAMKEAALVELFRLDQLSHRDLSEALGLDRFETEALLKQHCVTEDFPSADEYREVLRQLGIASVG